MGVCVLCEIEPMYWNYLCPKCVSLKTLMKVYTPEKVISVVNKCLIIPDDKLGKRSERIAIDHAGKT
jgi:hypothetical protein